MNINRDAIYTVDMVAEMLGVCTTTVYNMRQRGLKCRKPTGKAGKVYILGQDLYDYVAGQCDGGSDVN